MSKTVDSQIEKSKVLISALKKKYDEVKDKGIKMNDLEEMEHQLEQLKQANAVCEEMRQKLSAQVRHSNDMLDAVKEVFKQKKEIIKGYYPQERWMDYGVQDKR
jgi:urease gamma subunit